MKEGKGRTVGGGKVLEESHDGVLEGGNDVEFWNEELGDRVDDSRLAEDLLVRYCFAASASSCPSDDCERRTWDRKMP